MIKDYFPHGETSIVQWNENFKAQLSDIGLSLGFTQEEINTISAACTDMESTISSVDLLKAKLKEKTDEKRFVLKSRKAELRNFVRRIKASPNYTEAQGKLLGIVAVGSSFNPHTTMPEVKLIKTGVGYNFVFTLHGYFDAVAIFRKLPSEENYSQVGAKMKSPYSITSPPYSGCEYYFQYLKDDNLVGLKSDVIVVELQVTLMRNTPLDGTSSIRPIASGEF